MNEFRVQDWMSSEPITVDANTNLSAAYHLMRLNSIRRLPVIADDGTVVGIVTWGDLREAKPRRAVTPLKGDDWEARFLASTMAVAEIMTPDPLTIQAATPMRDAVALMLKHKVRGLPVVDDTRHLVGILTDSDVFRFVVDALTVATP